MDSEHIELESRLLRQKHRWVALVCNFLTRKTKYPDPSDPRRSAIAKALWLNLLFSPTTVAGGGLAIALITACLLFQQNQLLQSSLFPSPKFTAMVRPMIRAVSVTPTAGKLDPPDIGIEGRLVECAFAANDAGALYIATVNLKLAYIDCAGNLFRELVFEAKRETQLPVVAKSSIVPVELRFTKFGDITPSDAPPPVDEGPYRVNAAFSFSALDSSGEIWSAMLDADVIVIDGGEADTRKAALYLNGSDDALRAEFNRGVPPSLNDNG
tara:strand:+ start:30038 stop:30844 length:807 start_codon:yes stop_codon:yes gene_type:complete